MTYHVIGLAVAVLIHAAIIVHVKQRQRALSSSRLDDPETPIRRA
jgi:hypothetical protein